MMQGEVKPMLTRLRTIVLPASLFLAAAPFAVGCGSASDVQPATSQTASAATKGPIATNAHGPARFVAEALSEVPLRPDQRSQIEQLAADADARHASVEAAHKDLMLAVAAQVEAGQIDKTALQPKIDAAVAAFEGVRPADRAALEKLHAILDAQQRTEFVEALQAKMADAHEHHEGRQKMQEWATYLQLTDDQKSQIHDMMRQRFAAMRAEHGEHAHGDPMEHGEHGRMLEAFKGDQFDMDQVAPPVDAHLAATKMSDHMIGFLQSVLPVLTPQQRSLAAQKIRAQADGQQGHEEAF
jgi:hypothetical protein